MTKRSRLSVRSLSEAAAGNKQALHAIRSPN